MLFIAREKRKFRYERVRAAGKIFTVKKNNVSQLGGSTVLGGYIINK